MFKYIVLAITISSLVSCAQPSRMGMVEDPSTGLMWGSIIEKNIVLDSSQFENTLIKINLRNVSGDVAYDLKQFQRQLSSALKAKGYIPTEAGNFGIKYDVNVLYSGYVRSDLSSEFAFLAGAAGALINSRNSGSFRDVATGGLIGATLGAVAGSFVQDETYIVVAEVTIGVMDQFRGNTSKTITFSSSPPLQEERKSSVKPFDSILRTKVAVYAGGRNVSQSKIAEGVKERLARIMSNLI